VVQPAGPSSLKDRAETFDLLKEISCGAYARVYLSRKRGTPELFALKVQRRADAERKNRSHNFTREHDILLTVAPNPFVVQLHYAFTTRNHTCLVLEYTPGGDCASLLKVLGCLEEPMARTYVAEVVLALDFCHAQDVVHRDLKPENLLISASGHLKLADFGLSMAGVEMYSMWDSDEPQLRKVAGTPDYMAPEVLLGTGHGPEADWWSLGVVAFEFLTGSPAFGAETAQDVFNNVLNHAVSWPEGEGGLSPVARSLVDELLEPNPAQRLGSGLAGDIKHHAFFAGGGGQPALDWERLAQQKHAAAFVPTLEDELDTSYFASKEGRSPMGSAGGGHLRYFTTANGAAFA